jgi:phenylacetate-CoA ligase
VIFQPELETMPRGELEALQLERMRALVGRMAGAEVSSLAAIRKLPFTRKQDLRGAYPLGLLAVPREEVRRLHASSGTTGKPTVVPYTRSDLDVFATVVARCLAAAGAEPGMTLHNAYGYGLFTGGLGFHDGGERLGLAVVPVSGGMTERQLTLISDLRPDVIACTPSYALTLAQAFAERGIRPEEISLRVAMLGAEPWSEAMRREIDAGLGVRAVNVYGLSEVVGPGVSGECTEERSGLHVNEDHFLPEVVDPESGESLPEGEEGVLVFTTLTKEAFPLIRYWTGDIASLNRSPCSCGRTFVRMSPPAGRADDMLIIRGVNVYPSQVEAILVELPELTPNYRIVVDRPGTLDEATVEIEVGPGVAADDELRSRAERVLAETIGCSISVALKAPGELPRSEGGKLQRVDDRRRG